MGRKNNVARNVRSISAAVMPGPNLPERPSVTMQPSEKMSFVNGTDGRSHRLSWSRYTPPWNLSGTFSGGAYSGGAAGVTRDRNLASTIATDFQTTNSTVATIIEVLSTHAVGNGLNLSSKIDADAVGVTTEEARQLSSQIEGAWKRWAGNPIECDLKGTHTLHELALAGFRSYLTTGELLAVIDWKRMAGATTRTKVSLLDSRQLDSTKTVLSDGGLATMAGVTFNASGRVVGYFLVPLQIGKPFVTTQSNFVPARTPWNRVRVCHLFDLIAPGQVRGLSPLVSALTPAMEKNTLAEFQLDAALLQTQYALTVESDLPSSAAFNGLRVDDGLQGGLPAPQNYDPIGGRLEFYQQSKITAQPGVINHLAPGDKLKINRSETPNSTYLPFDKSLTRSAAMAAGAAFESISGDYSETSFSASRLSLEGPHRITMRRRATITEKLYRAVYSAWLEEVIETGQIILPKSALPFYQARDAYLQSAWLGSGRITADPLKAAQAVVLELEHGLTTLGDALSERGLDLSEVIEQRKAEMQMLREAGLPVTAVGGATNSTNAKPTVDQSDAEETDDSVMPPSKRRK